MLWIDKNFDYSDQLAYKYMKYNGEYYDVGTICKIKGHRGPVLVRFLGWKYANRWCFEAVEKEHSPELYNTYDPSGVMDYCLEIVIPIKPNLDKKEVSNSNVGIGLPERETPPSWDIEVGWIWYIAIMLIATIFKDRVMIWGFATVVFFLWKKGFLSK